MGNVWTISAIYQNLVVGVCPPLHLLVPHCPHVRVVSVHQPLPGVGVLVRQVPVVDPGHPGEQDHPSVAEHLVQEHLAGVIVTSNFDGLQFTNFRQTETGIFFFGFRIFNAFSTITL